MGWLHCYLALGVGLGHVTVALFAVWLQTAPRLCQHTFRENVEHLEAALRRASIQRKCLGTHGNEVHYALYDGLQPLPKVDWKRYIGHLQVITLDFENVGGKFWFQDQHGWASCRLQGAALNRLATRDGDSYCALASELLDRLIEIILAAKAHLLTDCAHCLGAAAQVKATWRGDFNRISH